MLTYGVILATLTLIQPSSWPFTTESPIVIGSEYMFTEGPAWVENRFIFCDMAADRVYSWNGKLGHSPETIRSPSGRALGTAAISGGMVQVESSGRRIIKWHPELPANITVVANKFENKRLGGMNDLAVHRNGSIYVTHANWFLKTADLDFQHSGVIRIDPKGTVTLTCDGLALPNGICFSPKGDIAYVTEYSTGKIIAFDISKKNGSFGNQRVFADLNQMAKEHIIVGSGGADGIRTDKPGNIFSTGPGGIWVLNPKAEFIAHLPFKATNLAFGGKDGKTLLITTGNAVAWIGVKAEY